MAHLEKKNGLNFFNLSMNLLDNFMRLTLIRFIIIIVLIFNNIALFSQVSVNDTTLERMMDHSQYKEASELLKKSLNQPGLDTHTRLYYNTRMGMAQFKLRKIDLSLNYARKSLHLATMATDSVLICDAWKIASYSYNHAGQLDSALSYADRMYQYSRRKGDDKLAGKALTSIASILNQNKRFEEALGYYRQVNALNIKIKDSTNFDIGYYNLGLTFMNLKQFDSCRIYFEKAIFFAKKYEHSDNLIYAYGTMADCYLVQKNKPEWKKYLSMANEIALKIGNIQFLAMGYSNLTTGSLQDNDFKSALLYGQIASDYLKNQPFPVLKIKIDSMLYIANKKSGNTVEALRLFESFEKQKHALDNVRQKERLNELVIKYEVKEKDLTIANQ